MCKSLAKAKRQQKRAAHAGGDTTAWSDDEEDSSDEEWDIEKVLGEKAREHAAPSCACASVCWRGR
jgi:hypothetical protein